jgi:hypothetical protein
MFNDVVKKLKRLGYSVRKVFACDGDVCFLDTGTLLLYVPSKLSLKVPSNQRVVKVDPRDSQPSSVEAKIFLQLERIMTSSKCDVTLLKHDKIFTGRRTRLWLANQHRVASPQLRIACDLDIFMDRVEDFRKNDVQMKLIDILLSLDVGPMLEKRKQEYVELVREILETIASKTAVIKKLKKSIAKARSKKTSFVSVDIETAHAVAKQESELRTNTLDFHDGKHLLKTAIINFSKFALHAELAYASILENTRAIEKANDSLRQL